MWREVWIVGKRVTLAWRVCRGERIGRKCGHWGSARPRPEEPARSEVWREVWRSGMRSPPPPTCSCCSITSSTCRLARHRSTKKVCRMCSVAPERSASDHCTPAALATCGD